MFFCEDIDECIVGFYDCLLFVRCVNMLGLYRCECFLFIGWLFDGKFCSDIDEC